MANRTWPDPFDVPSLRKRQRQSRWIIPEYGLPCQSVGFECNHSTDVLWFPGEGFSTSEHFDTEREALLVALKRASSAEAAAAARVSKLKTRLGPERS